MDSPEGGRKLCKHREQFGQRTNIRENGGHMQKEKKFTGEARCGLVTNSLSRGGSGQGGGEGGGILKSKWMGGGGVFATGVARVGGGVLKKDALNSKRKRSLSPTQRKNKRDGD